MKACPGDTFVIKKNGVVVGGGVVPASGEISVGPLGVCLAPGDIMTGVLNGNDADPFLGPFHG